MHVQPPLSVRLLLYGARENTAAVAVAPHWLSSLLVNHREPLWIKILEEVILHAHAIIQSQLRRSYLERPGNQQACTIRVRHKRTRLRVCFDGYNNSIERDLELKLLMIRVGPIDLI
jgi:hypothetical protein